MIIEHGTHGLGTCPGKPGVEVLGRSLGGGGVMMKGMMSELKVAPLMEHWQVLSLCILLTQLNFVCDAARMDRYI